MLSQSLQVNDGWCEGTKNGKRGMFPDNFVHLRPAPNKPPEKTPPQEPVPSESPVVMRETGMYYLSSSVPVSFILTLSPS